MGAEVLIKEKKWKKVCYFLGYIRNYSYISTVIMRDMMEHKRTNDKVWVDGIGYCVEVVHTRFINGVAESYTSYTPIESK